MAAANYNPQELSAKAGTAHSGLDFLIFQIQQMSSEDRTPADLRDLILMSIYHTQGILAEVQDAMEAETRAQLKR
ncbi:hypothetical protein [Limimaricola hongkongensis]|nr:hypothetical protein [Limimaricola hongkongensis]